MNNELVYEVNEDGKITNNKISKKEAHKKGICHMVSALALIDKKGRLLIQKRSIKKFSEPGKWDISSAGHVGIDELPIDTAIRETKEEIGVSINKNEIELIDTFLIKKQFDNGDYINHYTYFYMVNKDIDINSIKMQRQEVDDVIFVNKKEFIKLIKDNMMVEAINHCKKIFDYMK